jgi:hypothetical protein
MTSAVLLVLPPFWPRIMPIPWIFASKPPRAQTALTHGDPAVHDAAELFTRWVDGISQGMDIASALESATAVSYAALDAKSVLNSARSYAAGSPQEAAASLGLSCNVMEALPLTLCLALHFADKTPRSSDHQRAARW